MYATYWTVRDLAHHLSQSYDTVQKWPARQYGPLPDKILRGHRLYLPATVLAWQRSRQLKVVA